MGSRSKTDDKNSQSLIDILTDWYHLPVLLLIVGTMFAIRAQTYSNFIREGEVFFSGNDAWYHLREVTYITNHWPSPIPFDAWTGFPYGQWVGQFGTLYDQVIATVALLLGVGSPTQKLIGEILLITPAVAGALTAIPVFLIAKSLSGRIAGIFSAAVLMLLSGTFLNRTLVGVADHNAIEPLMMAIAVFGLVIAFQKAEATMPVWEVVREEVFDNREIDSIMEPINWSVIGGVLTGLYLWTWPPGVLVVGIVGVFTILKISSDAVNERTPEPTAFAVVVAMIIVAVMSFIAIDRINFDTTSLSLLQPIAAIGVASSAIALSWLARVWERKNIDASLYPVAVGGLAIAATGALSLLQTGVIDLVTGNLLRIVGFSSGAAARTVGEAQPFVSPGSLRRFGVSIPGRIAVEYGLTFFTGLAAAFILHAKPLFKKGTQRTYAYLGIGVSIIGLLFLASFIPDALGTITGLNEQVAALLVVSAIIGGATFLASYDGDKLFIIVWAAFITAMAFTQVRFNYYLAIVVAVFNGYLFDQLLEYLNLKRSITSLRNDIDGYQVLAVGAALLLILGPGLAVPISLGNTTTSPAWETAQNNGPGAVTVWDDSLEWMQGNTPEEGNLGGAGNADEMELYGTYDFTDDFAYPDGTYGVQSWWDYGHWITTRAERIPNANPFQQGATSAANFLLSANETQSHTVLNKQSTEGDQTRYVMVDWQMATPGSKFGAPTVFYDAEPNVSRSDFLRPVYQFNQQGRFSGTTSIRSERFYNSTMTRLYYYHGSARQPSPIAVDWEDRRVQTNDGGSTTVAANPRGNQSTVRTFNSMREAEAFVANDTTAQLGGIGAFPTHRVEALDHYRLVHVNNQSASRSILRTTYRGAQAAGINPRTTVPSEPAYVKTFERVPGATIEGTNAPANSTVTAQVELTIPNKNSTFTYTQQSQTTNSGTFSMTVPYSTVEHNEYGPENGYTDISVHANDSYTISSAPSFNQSGYVVSYQANVSVPEGLVNGDQSGAIDAELERNARELSIGGSGSSSNSESDSETVTGDDASGSGESSSSDGDSTDSSSSSGADSTSSDEGSNSESDSQSSLDSPIDDTSVKRAD
jgi:Uncharacterized membrane protein, required for N-linked glycosylation